MNESTLTKGLVEAADETLIGTVLRSTGGGFYEVHVEGLVYETTPDREDVEDEDELDEEDEEFEDDDLEDEELEDDDEDEDDEDLEDEDDLPEEDGVQKTLLCSLRGKLKHGRRVRAQPVSVGDRVRVLLLDSFGADARGRRLREGHITEVLPRTSELGRSRYQKTSQVAVANLDQVVIVMSLRDPDLNLHRLDRFLVLAEASELRAVICLNKNDLLKKRELKKEMAPIEELYGGLGYPVLATSAQKDIGIEELRAELKNHISAFIGSSGVGKSSLVMAVQPELLLWVGEVMEIGKGRHTTTEVSLHPLDGGGYIADTPGVKTIALLEAQEVNLPQCFPEFRAYDNLCRFNDCTHIHEPACAVRQAAEEGKIAASRYESYRRIHEDTALLQRPRATS